MIWFLLIQIIWALFFSASNTGYVGGTAYTAAEQQAILDAHNDFRANVEPPASNMIEMEWDQELAAQAQHWAELCVFEHPNKKEYTDYKGIGQNIFMRRPGKIDKPPPVAGPTGAWYNEVRFYNITSHTCTPGKVCGHYTQVVWATTTKVGCGIKFCPEVNMPKKQIKKNNAWLAVCNYSPAGNYKGKTPYIPGNPCSECRDGKLCKNNLCTDCSPDEDGCECKLECKNCGTTDLQTCQCSCPDGYFGELCETFCEDKSAKCGAGFPTKWCNKKDFVDRQCPLMCGHCTPGPEVDSSSC